MNLGTRILLLMLLITAGSSAVISWIVTIEVTRFETNRVNAQISQAIERYGRQLQSLAQQDSRTVQLLLEVPSIRSYLQSVDDPSGESARGTLQYTLANDIKAELEKTGARPAFEVLIDPAQKVVVTWAEEASLQSYVAAGSLRFPVDAVLGAAGSSADIRPVLEYLSAPQGLFLAIGVPISAQLDEPPSHAFFIGFRVDDSWVRGQLLAERFATKLASAPLDAWFVTNQKVVARGSADPANRQILEFDSATAWPEARAASEDAGRIEFTLAGERFLGQAFDLNSTRSSAGRLVLAASLDQALEPLHHLRHMILLIALGTFAVAFVACRFIASMIARPIQELLAGTQRVAAGRFDMPVPTGRRDELGELAGSFNQMAEGLRERDRLREERVKIERDMDLARKIQHDILPQELPICPGYELAALSLPAEATGGDIYDLVALKLDRPDASPAPTAPSNIPAPVVLLLADATGHGIGPAISVTQVRSMLRIGVRLQAGLDAIFSQINRQLCQDLGSGRFVTAFLGLLDPANHRIEYHSAGQGPLLHYISATRKFEWLGCSMLPLGIDEDAVSEGDCSIALAPSDLVVLLTDGFYEYRNASGDDQFGRERIAELILRHQNLSARALLDEILHAVRSFGNGAPQLDDMTALIIKRLAV